jgi:DMSO reductase anchor subunit
MLAITGFGLALALIVSGLLSSTLHLGRPERAWRALSQWRSSWLSREGVAAIVAFGPISLYAFLWAFFGRNSGLVGVIGVAAAILSLLTVYTTSMIYASLRTIPAWSNPWTPVAYGVFALATGGLLAAFLFGLWKLPAAGAVAWLVFGTVIAALCVKLVYWRHIDKAPARSTAESATGLGGFGRVKLIDAPHTQTNYLMEEMGFKIARKHARKLRLIALAAAFGAPALLLLAAQFAPSLASPLLALACASGAVGIAVERWLFFAEAKHSVTLYYGESRV